MWWFTKRPPNGSTTRVGFFSKYKGSVCKVDIACINISFISCINISFSLFKQSKGFFNKLLSAHTQLFNPWSRTKVFYYFVIEKSVMPVVYTFPEPQALKINLTKRGLDKFSNGHWRKSIGLKHIIKSNSWNC